MNGITFNAMRNIMSFPNPGRGPSSGLPPSFPGNGGNLLGQVLFGAATFAHNAGRQAEALSSSLAGIGAILDRVSAVSTNRDVMQVSSFTGTSVPDVSVVVEQVATAQRNAGDKLASAGRDFQPGSFSFEVVSGGESHTISFSTTEPLTNREFMERVAKEINDSKAPVSASVATAGGNSSLTVSSDETGVADGGQPRFALRDLGGSALGRLGVTEATQKPQNAVFSVNGGERVEQASNEVALGGGLTVTLTGASDEPASVKEGRDEVGMRAIMRAIVSQTNSLLETARANGSDNRTRSLVRELEGVLRRSRRDLASVGISMSQDGRLAVDESRFRRASEDGTMARVLGETGDRSSRFAAQLSRLAGSVAKNPMRHISPSALRLPGFNNALEIVANGGQNAAPNAFAAYFVQESIGSLFDNRS